MATQFSSADARAPGRDTGYGCLASDEESRVEALANRVYLIRVHRRVTPQLLERGLEQIWSSPGWRQPYGLVIVVHDDVSYDPAVRSTEIPPNHLRAVGTSIVSSNAMHRMVISSIGLTYGIVSRFVLSGHDTEVEAIERQRRAVETAEGRGRDY